MNNPIAEGVNTSGTGDEIHKLSGQEPEDVGGATNNSSTPVTFDDVARQIEAASDLLTRQF